MQAVVWASQDRSKKALNWLGGIWCVPVDKNDWNQYDLFIPCLNALLQISSCILISGRARATANCFMDVFFLCVQQRHFLICRESNLGIWWNGFVIQKPSYNYVFNIITLCNKMMIRYGYWVTCGCFSDKEIFVGTKNVWQRTKYERQHVFNSPH